MPVLWLWLRQNFDVIVCVMQGATMKMSAGGNKAKKKDLGAIVPCLSIFFGVLGGLSTFVWD